MDVIVERQDTNGTAAYRQAISVEFQALAVVSRCMFAALIMFCAELLAMTAAWANPTYHGVQVIINPYDATDMNFLTCAAYGKPLGALNQGACSVTPSSNPFVSSTNAATGILLRIPWCAFQIDMLPSYRPSKARGSCHYIVDGRGGTGVYRAGTFSDGSSQIAPTSISVELNSLISNLSLCRTQYDECPIGVLNAAAAAIATIAAANPASQLSLSLGLVAGDYTPISVLDRPGGSIDLQIFHRDNDNVAYCTRQPLAWKSGFINSYVRALDRLFSDIGSYPGMPPIALLKVSPMSAQSLEFDVGAAQDKGSTTALDPAGRSGNGIQNDPVLLCPDHRTDISPANGATLLLSYYSRAPAGSLTMADAYESAFGTVVGHEFGLMVKNGLMSTDGSESGILSIASMGQQAFAHVACDTFTADEAAVQNQPLAAAPCVVDPTPGGPDYNWSSYYFLRFVDHLFSAGTLAFASAQSAYSAIVRNGSYGLLPRQLAVNYTGLQPPAAMAVDFPSLPSCILNNVDPNPPFSQQLVLHIGSKLQGLQTDTISVPGTVLGTPGTLIGWQTEVGQAQYCGVPGTTNYSSALSAGVGNGGQFIEIETDAAGTSTCWPALRDGAVEKLVPANTSSSACSYSGN